MTAIVIDVDEKVAQTFSEVSADRKYKLQLLLTLRLQELMSTPERSLMSKSEVSIEKLPLVWMDIPLVYLPTRELLTIYSDFIAVYEGHYLEFEETWPDTCLLLGALLQRGMKEKRIKELLEPLEMAMGGAIELD